MLLVVNAGSSSLKFAVFDGLDAKLRGQVSGIGDDPQLEIDGEPARPLKAVASHQDAIRAIEAWLKTRSMSAASFSGIGHRLVHGGARYVSPVIVDDAVEKDLHALERLAPLHMPVGVRVLADMRQLAPQVPNIACFDTAFHATQPELETRLALPRVYFDQGYRRYGFHGLSYAHIVKALPELTGKPLPRRLIVAHLGMGASLCAIRDGKSVATTMGYSTADGLVMGTRTGSIDPGVLLGLLRDEHPKVSDLEDLLYRKSGMLGISGLSGDMRALLASSAPEAGEAVEHFCYSAARHAASLLPPLGGLDAMVFTGGIGEHAGPVRARILHHLGWLGLRPEQVHVIAANEELTIARDVLSVTGQ
ncbi:acetate/propionate family kinase [Aestuariivirga sp.]|uniref:acetate/propionate family kinase n=1 Tax=Aestuariivirga sp. TaxID=2650926 RepID=UPI0039E467EA